MNDGTEIVEMNEKLMHMEDSLLYQLIHLFYLHSEWWNLEIADERETDAHGRFKNYCVLPFELDIETKDLEIITLIERFYKERNNEFMGWILYNMVVY